MGAHEALSALESLRQNKPTTRSCCCTADPAAASATTRKQSCWGSDDPQRCNTATHQGRASSRGATPRGSRAAVPAAHRTGTQEGDHWLNLAACQKALKQMVAPLQTLQATWPCIPSARISQALVVPDRTRPLGRRPALHAASLTHNNSTDVQQFNLHFAAAGNDYCQPTSSPRWPISGNNTQPHTHTERPHQDPHRIVACESATCHRICTTTRQSLPEPLLRGHPKPPRGGGGGHQLRSYPNLERLCDRWLPWTRRGLAAAAGSPVGLDVLVELGDNRRPAVAAAHRSAGAIQLSYLGYFATPICAASMLDGDAVVLPNGLEQEPRANPAPTTALLHGFQPDHSPELSRTAPDSASASVALTTTAN